jgi:hypothetical protein
MFGVRKQQGIANPDVMATVVKALQGPHPVKVTLAQA